MPSIPVSNERELIEFLTPNPNQAGSLYTQLARSLSRAIDEGLLKNGDYLLPQRELAEALGVSRVTVRKAIETLVNEGLLRQRQGAGTIVTSGGKQSIHKHLSVLNSFTEDMLMRGMRPASRWVSRQTLQSSPREAMALNVSPGARIARFTRVRFASETPMAYEIAAVPASIIGDADKVGDSLYQALDSVHARPVRALQTMTARNADAEMARYLKIAPNDALLYIERQGFDSNNRPVEFTRSWFRGDIYDFVTELSVTTD